MAITKYALALFLIGFWLFLPVPMMLFGVGGFEEVTQNVPENIDNPAETGLGFFAWLKPITQGISLFFNLLVFNIVGIDPILARFINFLQLSTLVFVLVMLRGN